MELGSWTWFHVLAKKQDNCTGSFLESHSLISFARRRSRVSTVYIQRRKLGDDEVFFLPSRSGLRSSTLNLRGTLCCKVRIMACLALLAARGAMAHHRTPANGTAGARRACVANFPSVGEVRCFLLEPQFDQDFRCSVVVTTRQMLSWSERPERVLAGEHGRIEGIYVQSSNWSTVAWQKQVASSE